MDDRVNSIDGGIFPRGFSAQTRFPFALRRSNELVELCYGKALREPDRVEGNVPVYGTNGRCGWHNDLLSEGPGVILGRKGMGPLGVEWCETAFWVIDTAYYVRPKTPQIDLEYFYYLVKFIGLNHLKDGTSNPSLSRDTFGALLLPTPDIKTQRQIATLLRAFDKKIELNRRMNETLEAMARRLFKSWFVDFDPVQAKAAARREHPKLSNAELSRRALPKMASEIAEFFPDSFEESNLGLIPKGWQPGVIGDLAVLDKSSINPIAFPNELFDHYSIPAFDDGMKPASETGDQIKSNKFIVTDDCILLTKLNPHIPRVWLPFPSTSRRSLCSTEFLVLRPKPSVSREFLFSHVSSRSFFEVYETMVTGTSGSHQRIRPENLLTMQLALCPEPLRRCFTEAVASSFAHSESIRRESRSLEITRDKLLPRLLSGELPVTAEVS